jgi:hypothetical protein
MTSLKHSNVRTAFVAGLGRYVDDRGVLRVRLRHGIWGPVLALVLILELVLPRNDHDHVALTAHAESKSVLMLAGALSLPFKGSWRVFEGRFVHNSSGNS